MVYSVDIPMMPALIWRQMETSLYGGDWSGRGLEGVERSVAEFRMYCMRKEQRKRIKWKIKILEWKQASKQKTKAYNIIFYWYNVVETKQNSK